LQRTNQDLHAEVSKKTKVVEMTSLQRSVLTVVGEAQQLAWVRLTGLALSPKELAQCRERQNSGGRGSPFARQAGQAVDVFPCASCN
jgi:hypothetical protein